jgi:hypothetical protein
MFALSPIGFIESPYKESSEIPKGLVSGTTRKARFIFYRNLRLA